MNRTCAMQRRARELSVQLQLAPPFQPTEFVERVATQHQISIHLEPFPMLGTVTGYCLRPDESAYIVFYDPDASAERHAHVIYHEVAHIVLGHVLLSTPEQIAQILALRDVMPPRDFVPMFQRQRYGLRFELDAEALAIALTALSLRSPSLAYVIEDGDSRDIRSRIAEYYRQMGI